MADHSQCMPLAPESIREAHKVIKPHIHRTPLLTSRTLDKIASMPTSSQAASPTLRLFFKCENYQKIGAFKARGAFHALTHLFEVLGEEEVRKRGVVTHSSGNHAQALALAASTFSIPAYIVMPTISTPSKIAGTRSYTDHVIFSGSNSQEREAKVEEVIAETGAILVPPYDHPDIMLGQGTAAFEMEEQYQELQKDQQQSKQHYDMVISPLGGGGLLSGIATFFSEKPETRVFGAEPSFSGCDDGKRGLESNPPARITTVNSLTIADGLRTPVGELPWKVITSGTAKKPKFLQGVRSVSEEQIKAAMRLLMERMKLFVEPSACVGLAALLYDEDFRSWIVQEQQGQTWDIGVVLTGGNTTIEAIVGMFGDVNNAKVERQEAKVGLDGKQVAENVAG